ncbi:MAG: hypothetical protein KGH58_04275 [Candidatus Micrarchaeota archaeon]|nr:hypothetical protein [Candidatus Micrarchaeota archaeon]
MASKAIIAISACIIVAAVIITAASYYGSLASKGARSGIAQPGNYQNQTSYNYSTHNRQGPGGYNQSQGVSTIQQSAGSVRPGTFVKVYVGQSLSVDNTTISLVGVDRSSPLAILTVSSGTETLSDMMVGPQQYLAVGPGNGAPYVLVSGVSYASSVSSQDWANLTLSFSSMGFSQAQGSGNGQNSTTNYRGNLTNATTGNSTRGNNTSNEMRAYRLPACGANRVFFSVTPITENNFTSFAPLGWVSPRGHVIPSNHGGFYIRQIAEQSPSNVTPANVSVFAPVNVTVFEIVGQTYLNANLPSDYAIYFAPCSNITFYYGHVQELAAKLASAYVPPFTNCQNSTANGAQLRTCEKMMNLSFAAGEKMGNIGGLPSNNGGVEALDMGVYDYTLPPAGFANQSRYDTEELHAACPLNYFDAAIQSHIYGMIGIPGMARTAQPLCGAFMEDIPGTAQGTWFQRGTPVPFVNEGLLISLMDNDFLPNSQLFSVGLQANITGLAGVTYYFTPAGYGNVNTDFGNVTADGQVHCYGSFTDSYSNGNTVPGIILLRLLDSNTLEIEYQNANGCGTGPWEMGPNAATLYR